MRARVKLRDARLASEQSHGTAQVSLGVRTEAPGVASLRWTTRSARWLASTRSTKRQPVPPQRGHCESAMIREHRLSTPWLASEREGGKNRKCEKSGGPNQP